MNTIGNRMKSLRSQNKISRQKLADRLGLSYSAVAMYERDLREPNSLLLKKMSLIFEVSVDYIVGLVDNPTTYVMDENKHNYPPGLKEELKNYENYLKNKYGVE